MGFFVGLNRRSNRDRRLYDEHPPADHRHTDRRRYGTDRYVVVMGDTGIDRFGLLVGIPVAILLMIAVLGTFMRS